MQTVRPRCQVKCEVFRNKEKNRGTAFSPLLNVDSIAFDLEADT